MIGVFLILLVAVVLAAPYLREWAKPGVADVRDHAPGQFADLPQGTTHYRWVGPEDGPVVVCVHGLTTPSFVWGGMLPGLVAQGYRVLIYDLYGRGFSDRPKGVQDGAFFTAQLAALMQDQGVSGPVTLIGYSMGGAIVTDFAATHPERVKRLILLAPAGMGHELGTLARLVREVPVFGDWLFMAGFARNHRFYTEAERSLPSKVPGIVDMQLAELRYRGFVPSVLASLKGMLGRALIDEHEAIAQAGIPVLAIWGQRDDVIPIRCMGRLSEWNRDAVQEVLDDAGHALTYTHPDDVLAAIKRAQ